MAKVKIFDNGLTVVVDKMDNYESVAFNMFVKTGSVNETEGYYGISHFIEHMVFKGTKTRTSAEISTIMDAIGANINAYTDKTETTFFTKTTADNLEICVDVLSDMLFNSIFDKKEMEREKKVVIEEIKMYDDDPYAKSEILADSKFYANTPFARDVASTKNSVLKLTRSKILKYMSKYYIPSNIILSFAGNITPEKAYELVERFYLKNFNKTQPKTEFKNYKTEQKINIVKAKKENEQTQVHIEFSGLYVNDERKYALKLISVILGVGMSSRLFQQIREKMGLVYAIQCDSQSNYAGGEFDIHFATSFANVPLALSAVAEELIKAKKGGFLGDEFQNAKNNIISTIKLKYENTDFVSLTNAKSMAINNVVLSKNELIEQYQKVSLEEVNKLISNMFSEIQFTLSLVGTDTKINPKKYFKL